MLLRGPYKWFTESAIVLGSLIAPADVRERRPNNIYRHRKMPGRGLLRRDPSRNRRREFTEDMTKAGLALIVV